MRHLLAAVCILLLSSSLSQAKTLYFDESSLGHISMLPDGYGFSDLAWSGVYSLDIPTWKATHPSSGYPNGLVSGNKVAFSAPDAYIYSPSGDLFDFESVYMTAAWRDNMDVQVIGYKNSVVLYNKTVTVSTSNSTLFNFNFNDIDALGFVPVVPSGTFHVGYTSTAYNIVMDNFTLSDASTSPTATPEPGTMLLMGIGAVGVAFMRRRKVKSDN